MNCLDYRRQLGPDPRHESAEMQEHRRGCAGCAAHHARALGFELALKRSLAVPVPDGLAERILLSQTTSERGLRVRRRRRWSWAAAAAAVVATVGLVAYQLALFSPLPRQLVLHLQHEPEALITHTPLAVAAIEERFRQRGVRLAGPPPAGVSYAQPCPVGVIGSVHMVMPEKEGPVTVFFLPGHKERRGDYVDDGMHVRAVPMAEGTLALVAADARHFDALEAGWRRSLEGASDIAAGAP
ncbi:MAG TPA: DUF3379 family protein [Tahibacter sp.]|uniref:DUF3379 family protein n=1 Tax=Tahibacter sp. TaxID=2056211 RepID=UPI002C8F0B97|nr:DUF3379 family protein [Tahibacter sp.]HSX59429.1 DUF3379 family protein [Tahibacter sp.]